jgi:hypothetical protein
VGVCCLGVSMGEHTGVAQSRNATAATDG